jgi:hypothetical protein
MICRNLNFQRKDAETQRKIPKGFESSSPALPRQWLRWVNCFKHFIYPERVELSRRRDRWENCLRRKPGAYANLPAVQKLVQKHFGAV